MKGKQRLRALIEENNKNFEEISDAVWGFAELCFEEHQSSELQMKYMQKDGFRITSPVCGMDTAFIAEYGFGSPVIAILGENDALANQSQCAEALEHKPIEVGASGHGCGHHILGTAGMEAACALKRYMEENGVAGTIRYYACPAEEGGGGKVYLANGGAFDDVDAAVTWHPSDKSSIAYAGKACITFNFRFTGRASHASGAPWDGRSAFDAVELMNVGAQFLREHMHTDCRIHYAVLDCGGTAPNVVPHSSEVQYVVRSMNQDYINDLYSRVCDIAKGAALMTSTTVSEPKVISAYSTRIYNDTLADLLIKNWKELLPVEYTSEEMELATKYNNLGLAPNQKEPMCIELDDRKRKDVGGTTDANDVSWFIPVCQADMTVFPKGCPGHGWIWTTLGKSSLAHKGMHMAAKVMSGTVLDLLENPEVVKAAKEEFKKNMEGKKYTSYMTFDRFNK